MSRKSVRWGADIGYQSSIKPFKAKESLAKHGLRGKLGEGDLGFSRGRTRKIAQEDAADALAIALCHAHMRVSLARMGGATAVRNGRIR